MSSAVEDFPPQTFPTELGHHMVIYDKDFPLLTAACPWVKVSNLDSHAFRIAIEYEPGQPYRMSLEHEQEILSSTSHIRHED